MPSACAAYPAPVPYPLRLHLWIRSQALEAPLTLLCYTARMKKRNRPRGWWASPLISALSGRSADVMIQDTYHGKTGGVQSKPPKPGPHPGPKPPGFTDKCPCMAFKAADAFYHENADALRPVWHPALKKPVLSAYTLFMKEAIALCISTGMLPLCPSISGGYSCLHLIPSENEMPPAGDWIGKAPAAGPGPPAYGDDAPPSDDECPNCILDTPTFYDAHVEGVLFPYEPLNAHYHCPQIPEHPDPCEYGVQDPNPPWCTFFGISAWDTTIQAMLVIRPRYEYVFWTLEVSAPYQCYAKMILPFSSQHGLGLTAEESTCTIWAKWFTPSYPLT